MANRFAVVNGNFNATSTWSDTPTGVAGASVPVSGDNAYANAKTVTITADATCTKISTEAENGATGSGSFNLNGGVILNADVKTGSLSNTLLVSYAAPLVSTINGNITGGSGVANNTIVIQGYASGGGTLNINGNVTAGTNNSSRAIYINGSTTINIVGAVLGTTTSAAILVNDYAVFMSITGSVTSVGAGGISFGSNYGSLTINGNVYGGTAVNNAHAITISSSQLVVTGNVYAGTSSASAGIVTNSNTTANVTINGNIYGSDTNSAGVGFSNNSIAGTVTINGAAYAGRYTSAISNVSIGTLKVIRAVGSSFGLTQNLGVATAVGVSTAAYNGSSYVEQIEYGSQGMTPTYGPILLTDKISNVALLTKSSGIKKTLYDATNVTGALPAASDVRYGVVYNYSANSGTCRVPAASSVAYGVLVDNTTGTAVLTASAIWDSLTSTMTTSGSIGERLKNVSTIASTSQQLADALSA